MTRCSVASAAGLLPALTAGLPGASAIVLVGPPLFASKPSLGSVFAGRLWPPAIVAPDWLRIRLKLAVTDPSTSGADGLALFATIVLAIETVPPAPARAIPPPVLAVLAAIVLLWTTRVPPPAAVPTMMPPPPVPAVLLALVPLRTVQLSAEVPLR